jgi:hypothetical protein
LIILIILGEEYELWGSSFYFTTHELKIALMHDHETLKAHRRRRIKHIL